MFTSPIELEQLAAAMVGWPVLSIPVMEEESDKDKLSNFIAHYKFVNGLF